MSQTTNNKPLELSPISAWTDGELVKLPSGRVMRLRQIDVLSVVNPADASVPNFLIPMLMSKKAQTTEVSGDDLVKLLPLMNQVTEQAVTEPRIVKDMDAVHGGQGILLSMISMQDKSAILSFCMGGEAAIDSVMRFQQQQAKSVDSVPEQKSRPTE